MSIRIDSSAIHTDGFTMVRNFFDNATVEALIATVRNPTVGTRVIQNTSTYEKRVQPGQETSLLLQTKQQLEDLIMPHLGRNGEGQEFIQLLDVPCNPRAVAPDRVYFHIDGRGYLALNKGTATWDALPGFKVAVGIYLNDLSQPQRGNLLVARGGHRLVEDYFKGPGLRHFPDGKFQGDGLAVSDELCDYIRPRLSFEPVFASPGDVIIFHCLLPHSVDVNTFENRPAIYTRLGKFTKTGLATLQDTSSAW